VCVYYCRTLSLLQSCSRGGEEESGGHGTCEEPGTLTQGAPVFPGSSRLGIEPKTLEWLVQDPTTRPIGDLIPTIGGSDLQSHLLPFRAGRTKKVHSHGLLGISRGTSAAELHFCSWKSWFSSPLTGSHTMMPAPGEKSEATDLMEMIWFSSMDTLGNKAAIFSDAARACFHK
jgi:hypothetical protein